MWLVLLRTSTTPFLRCGEYPAAPTVVRGKVELKSNEKVKITVSFLRSEQGTNADETVTEAGADKGCQGSRELV